MALFCLLLCFLRPMQRRIRVLSLSTLLTHSPSGETGHAISPHHFFCTHNKIGRDSRTTRSHSKSQGLFTRNQTDREPPVRPHTPIPLNRYTCPQVFPCCMFLTPNPKALFSFVHGMYTPPGTGQVPPPPPPSAFYSTSSRSNKGTCFSVVPNGPGVSSTTLCLGKSR